MDNGPGAGKHDPLGPIRAGIAADLAAGPEAIDAARPPEFVCRPRLPVAGGNLAAPGGTGKTTVMLNEKVRVACGHELYGDEVEKPGDCVVVTAEDGAERLRFMLQQVLRDGVDSGAMPERAALTAKQRVRIVGWPRASYGPIAEVDQAGGMMRAPAFDLLIEMLQPMKPCYVSFDPSVLFSPGERYGNDGDAFLASMFHEAALDLGAFVQMIDHVAQSVARNGIVDQYAARGGTAKTDNARLARQLVRVTPQAAATMAVPLAVTPQDIAEGRVLMLHSTKSNYAPIGAPVWLRRRRFWVEHLRAPSAAEVEASAAHDRQRQAAADADLLVAHVRHGLTTGAGIRYSRRDLEDDARPALPDGSQITRARVREALRHALATGELVEMPLPEGERRGQRKTYISPPEVQP